MAATTESVVETENVILPNTTTDITPSEPVVVESVIAPEIPPPSPPAENKPPVVKTEKDEDQVNIENGTKLFPNDDLLNSQLTPALATLRSTELQSPIVIAEAQTVFYNCLSRILVRKTEKECFTFLNRLLTYIHINHDVQFTSKLALRSIDRMKLTAEQIDEFRILLFLFIDTAEPNSRHETAKIVNWDTVRSNLVTTHAEQVLSRLRKLFNV